MKLKTLQIIFLFFVASYSLPSNVQGQSVIGGELSYRYLTINTYEVTLDVYADCKQSILSGAQVVSWRDLSCGVSANSFTVNLASGYPKDVSPICSDSVNACNGGQFMGRHHYRYTGVLSLSGGCSNVLMSWAYQFRQNTINTLSSPSTQPFYVEARFDGSLTTSNSAPQFIYDPLFFSCRNKLINYSYKAIDPDGDSLAYSLVNCRRAASTNVNYIAPYNGLNPINTSGPPLAIDNKTGAIQFNSASNQDAPICVLVQEYRNGVLIGGRVRDVQLRTRGCSHVLPTLSGVNNTTNYQTSATINTPLNFFVIGNDLGNLSPNINVTMRYDNTVSGATFSTTPATAFGPDAVRGDFNWTPAVGDQGVHTFTIYVDDNNCPRIGTRIMTYRVNVLPAPPSPVTTSPDTSICLGDSARLNAFGAGPNPTYQWVPSTGLSNPNIPNPKASPTSTTTYTVTANYSNSTSASSQVVVTVNPRPVVSISGQTDATCSNTNDGTATAIATGTIGPYSYQWDAGAGNQTTSTAVSLSPGTYKVVARDANTCKDSVFVNIGAPSPIQAFVVNSTDILCHGDSTGSITVGGSGGVPGYTYLWDAAAGGQTTATAINLKANINYCVTVTNQNGCFDVTCHTLTEPTTPVSVNAIVSSNYNGANISCFGAADGEASALSSGGVGGYSISWNTGATIPTVIGGAGRYIVTVTDANSCSAVDSVDLFNPPPLNVNITNIVHVVCFGDSTGEATGAGSGGVGNYTYNWSNGQTGPTAVDLRATSTPYIITVIDDNGCTTSDNVFITQNPAIAAPDIQAVDTMVCIGDTIYLTTNTVGDIRYHWAGPSGFRSNLQSPTIFGATSVHEGVYFLEVEDTITGCFSEDTSLYIEVNRPPNPPSIIGGGVICDGSTIRIEDQNLVSNTALLWQGPVVDQTGTFNFVDVNPGDANYQSGIWTLEYTDTLTGCTATSNPLFVSLVPTPPRPNPVINGPVCVGGSVSLSVPFVLTANVNWYENPSRVGGPIYFGNNVTIPGITSDTTFYVEYSTPNCRSQMGLVNIVVSPNPPRPDISPDMTICEGDLIYLYTTVNADTFRWSHPNHTLPNQQTISITPSVLADSGIYTLSIVDTNGCTSPDTSVHVTINANPIAPLAETNSPICRGEDLELYHSGGCSQSVWLAPNGAAISTSLDTLTLLSTDPNYGGGNWRFICEDILTGCVDTSNFVNVQIDPSPPFVNGFNNGPVCMGDEVRLGVPLVNGASYNWFSDSLLTIPTIPGTGPNPTVPNITTDSIFYVEVSIGNCSSIGRTLVRVHPVSPKPDVPADFEICEGDTLSVTTSTVANRYQWILPSGGTVNNRTVRINNATPSNGGTYTLSIVDTNDCNVPDTTVYVTVNPLPNPPSISSNPICDEDSLILVASGTCGAIEWTGPSGASFIAGDTLVVLPGTPNYQDGGNWTASCIDTATGCQSLLSNHIAHIRPIPLKPAINNDGPVCFGESVELSTPIVAGAFYRWYDQDSILFIGPGNIIDIPNITSDTIFLLSIELNGCTNSDTTHVSIYTQPNPPILPDTIEVCEFDTLELSTSTLQPVYEWTGPNGFNSTQQEPLIYPATLADSGYYVLVVEDANGCPSEADSIQVIIHRLPAAPNITAQTTAICDGDTLFLASDRICDELIWEGPSGATFVGGDSVFIDSFDVNYLDGDWTVLCVDTVTGCSQISNTLTTTIKPLPRQPILANNSPICAGDTVDLSMSLVAGAFYQWFAFDSTRIDTVSSISIGGLENDTIFYGVIVVNGCSNFDTTHVTVHSRPATPNVSVEDTVCSNSFIQFVINPPNPAGTIYDVTGPNGYSSSGTSTTPFVFPIDTSATGIYTISATDGNGCESLDTAMFILVNPTPSIPTITGTSLVCQGDSIRLEGGSCDSLVWSNLSFSVVLSTVNNPSLVIGPGMPGYDPSNHWQVRCFDRSTGCESNFSNPFRVDVNNPPSGVTPTNDGPICFNGNATLSIAQQSNPSTYIWSTDSLLTDTVGTGTVIVVDSLTSDTTFYVEVKDAFGCSTIGSTQVLVYPALGTPDIDVLDSVICEGEDINLSELNYSIGHEWMGPNGFASSSASPTLTTATPSQSGIYRVFIVDGNGCPSPVDSITILVHALPTAPIITGGGNVCDGDSILFSSNTTCDSTVWVSALDTLLGNGNVLGISDLDAGYGNATWQLFCYDTISGCFASSNVLGVNIVPTPSLPIINNNNPVCFGDSAILITSTAFGASSVWYSDSLLNNSIRVGDTLMINTISNDSIVYLRQEANGCFSPVAIDTIIVAPVPSIPNIGADQIVCQGDSIYLTTTTLGSTYFWTDSSGFTSIEQNPIIPNASLVNSGTYHLFLIDSNGCAAPRVSMKVDVSIPPPTPLLFGNDTTCNGDTLVFGSNKPTNVRIEWVTPNSDTFQTDSLVIITSDSIYYQFGQWTVIFTDTLTGCQRSKDTIFRIETIPTAGALSNSGPVCIGDSVTLSTASIAGATSYLWFRGDTTIADIGQTVVIPDIVSDTFFALVVQTALGCNYFMDTNIVLVHPPSSAPPIDVDTTNCINDFIQFQTNPATSYTWTGPNGVFSLQQNPNIGPVTTADEGLYTLQVVDANGCYSPDTSIFVYVSNPPAAPTASAPSPICQGDTLFLNSTAGSCDSAYWIGPGNRILPTANAVIPSDSSAYTAGNWQVFCVDTSSGCEIGSNIVAVSIQTLARPSAINNGPVCLNDSVRLTANFVSGASYLWFSDSLRMDTIGRTQIISVDSITTDSTFYVVLINSNGCVSPLAQTTVNVHPLAPAPGIGSDVRVCEGEGIQLTGQFSLFGHSWTGPNGFTSTQQNPIISNATLSDTGTYTFSIVGFNGCLSADTSLHVIVDSLPDEPTIGGFVYLCANDTLFLSSDSVTTHCDSVEWIGPNGVNYAVSGRNIAIPPGDTNHTGGLWRIRCIDTLTGCFSTSNFSLVIIVPNPDTQATASDGPICVGGTVNLSTAPIGATTSYTWYADSTLTNIAGTGTNPSVSNITTDTTFYLVITNGGGCTSDPIPTAVSTYPLANAPLIAIDTQHCVGDSIVFSTPTIAVNYFWSGSNGFADTVQNPLLTPSATVLDSGLYSLSVIDSNGCISKDTTFRIVINNVPLSPTIVSNSPICDGDTLVLSSNGLCGQAQWIGPLGNSAAVLGTPGGGNNLWTIGTTTTILPNDNSYGNATWYMICIDTITGCRSTSNTITVAVGSEPNITNISNTGPICTGDTVALSIAATVTSGTPVITWYRDIALNQAEGIGANVTVPNVTNTTTFYVEVLDTATGCTALDSTVVTVHPVSLAPNMPVDTALCEGDILTLFTTTSANSYSWTGPNGFTASVQNPNPFAVTTLDSGTYYLVVVDNNNCPSLPGSVVVEVNPLPNAPIASNSSPGCTGDSIVLMASTITGATYNWYKLPLGTSIGQGQNYTLNNVTLADTGSYYVVVTLNGCTEQSNATTVTLYNNSSAVAITGADQNLCGIDTTTITATIPPANTTGVWTTSSGATIVNPTAATTFVANLPIGTNVFYWTLSNATCPSISTDSLIVVVAPQSTDIANAGVDQNLCGISTTTLTGSNPTLSNGTWTQSPAQAATGATIGSINDPLSPITGLIPGNSYTFVWEFDNGACGIHSTDTVEIDIAVAPSISAQAGGNIVTCSQDTLLLNATSPSIGTGIWTTNTSAVIITPNQPNTIVTNLQQDTTLFIWTLSNGACVNYSADSMLVILGGASPIANADHFSVVPSNSAIVVNVRTNDVLTNNWDIYINTPMNEGQMVNLNNGEFELNLQGVLNNQSFIYELCNPVCPSNCDTALVLLDISPVLDCDIPNIFTPNEDGVNDLFEVSCLDNAQVAKLLVFNRWGDLVYQSDHYQNQWNGTHQGRVLPDGTYFYIIKIGDQEQIQGSVELRR